MEFCCDKYLSMASYDGMERLAQKYGIMGICGDQDWLTLVGWEMEEIIHTLPCQFNRQIQAYVNHEISCFDTNLELYDLFHKCDNKSKILHFIGTYC